jgi:hypothetical protein
MANPSVDGTKLLSLMRGLLTGSAMDGLESAASGPGLVTLANLKRGGVGIRYDPAAVQIVVTADKDAEAAQTVSIAARGAGGKTDVLPKSDVAALVSGSVVQNFDHLRTKGFGPLSAAFDGFVSWGGATGLALLGRGRYSERRLAGVVARRLDAGP